jgi:N-acyl-D-amino-acid deacylase
LTIRSQSYRQESPAPITKAFIGVCLFIFLCAAAVAWPRGNGRDRVANALAAESLPSAQSDPKYDVIIKNGHVIDGTGNPWYAGDVGISGDRVVAIGNLKDASAKRVIDATGLVVAPGFIDMLGQSEVALLIDNRSPSKLSQGITSEITGEGASIAPQNERTLAPMRPVLEHYHVTVDWSDLDGYFQRLEKTGTPINLGTYVGAAQVRQAILGDVDRGPTPAELEQMESLVAQAMQQGALGISSSLIYPPGHYAKTDELIALAKIAAQYGGIYATHMRSEGHSEMQAVDETIRIGREAGLPVEIFHLKVAGKSSWGHMPDLIAKIQAARDSGLDIAANMYPYVAGGTALSSALPPWAADGGMDKLLERLRDLATRKRIAQEMGAPHQDWENLYYYCGGGAGVMISSVLNPDLNKYTGKTVAEMAKDEHKTEMDALFDFILADRGQTGALYFMASDQDLQYGLKQAWTSIGLDANVTALDGLLFEPHTHPRGWGSMPRFLGHYARDLHLLPLEAAIRKITSLPAQRVHLVGRGLLKPGFFADITVFGPTKIIDGATYAQPNQASQGIEYVLVNGQLEYEQGRLTGAIAGRALRGTARHSD